MDRRLAALALAVVTLAACQEKESTTLNAGADSTAAPAAQRRSLDGLGLSTPESAMHYAVDDVYFVSNIGGSPDARDGNGFISRIRPNGTVDSLRWIAGGRDGVRLNAPKGMAVGGSRLYVADLDTIRIFDLTTGAPDGAWGVPGALYLNDVAVADDGTVYATDSGTGDHPEAGAVYHFDASGRPTAIARGAELGRPNGIVVEGQTLLVASMAGDEVYQLETDGTRTAFAKLPAGTLDGLLLLPDGSLLVTSWDAQAVFRVEQAGGQATMIADGLESPADIGYDGTRKVILVPQLMKDRLALVPLP